MPKVFKYIAIAVAALVAILAIGLGVIAATFNPNDYKPQLIKLVQEKKQRTLTIPGDISLSFFPMLGADLGKISISERNSTSEFASVESAKLSLALIPLLSKRFVVDQIHIDGLRAVIRKNKDGSNNFSDFAAQTKPSASSGDVHFDIDKVDINNAYVLYEDQKNQRRLELAKFNLLTGKVANGVPSKFTLSTLLRTNAPEINAVINLKSRFTFDLDRNRYVMRDMNGEAHGNLLGFTDMVIKLAGTADITPGSKKLTFEGIKLSATGKHGKQTVDAEFDLPQMLVNDTKVNVGKIDGKAKLMEGTRTVNAVFAVPSFEGSPQAFKLPAVTLDTTVKDAHLDARAKLSGQLAGDLNKMLFTSPQLILALSGKQADMTLNGTLTTSLAVNVQAKRIDLADIAANFALPNPGGGMLALAAKGNIGADWKKENIDGSLNGKLDESHFDARFGVAGFSSSSYSFHLDVDHIDLDRYRNPDTALVTAASRPAQPADFTALKEWNATGKLRIGALKAANVRVSNLQATLRAEDGILDVNPLTANLYGGKVNGSLSLIAAKPLRVEIKQNLSGVHVGPLLKDALQKEPVLEGTGHVRLDVTTSGANLAQLKKELDGTARIELHEGNVKGINIAQTIRNVQAKLGASSSQDSSQGGTSSASEKTDFSEMTSSFRIADGIAHNDDLDLKSPLLRVGGKGDINLGEDRLDYLAKATIVSSLKGQGGPELQALRGITIPVRLSGPYTAITWRIDVASMADAVAKQKFNEQKEVLKAKAQKPSQEGWGNTWKGLPGK